MKIEWKIWAHYALNVIWALNYFLWLVWSGEPIVTFAKTDSLQNKNYEVWIVGRAWGLFLFNLKSIFHYCYFKFI